MLELKLPDFWRRYSSFAHRPQCIFLAPPSPSPPPPKKKKKERSIVFNFSWVDCNIQERLK